MARGIQHYGAFSADTAAKDVIDTDALQAIPTILVGSADAIPQSTGGNFVINSAVVDAITLPLPIAGQDDNLSLAIYSATAHAHTVTLPSAQFANGAALATAATFKAYAGSGLLLRAWNGTWQVLSSNVTSIS